MKILAVDDDEILLELLVETLSMCGFGDVSTAPSAKDALDLIAALDGGEAEEDEGTFECFLLDIQMPDMDGIALCDRIRSMPGYKRAPIIMITAMTDRSFVDRAFMAGATDYVTKPFDMLELGSRVRLANVLVNEHKKALENYFVASSLESDLDDRDRVIFEEPVVVEGIQNVVDYQVLENYLLQLSRRRVYDSLAVGFRFLEAEKAFSTLPLDEFHQLLAAIADAISGVMRGKGCITSYFGCGYFVGVMDKRKLGQLEDIEPKVNAVIESMQLNRDGFGIEVVVGNPAINSLQSFDNVHTMLLGAIEAVAKITMDGEHRSKRRRTRVKALKYNVSNSLNA